MKRPADLPAAFALSPEEAAFFCGDALLPAPPFAVSRHLLSLMDPADPADPIRRQFIPTEAELRRGEGEREDPLGEEQVQPVAGLLHRYPDRALLLASGRCAAYCRHCFRRRQAASRPALSPDELARAAAYVDGRPEIRELILSGGDPLMLSDGRLQALFAVFRRNRPELALRIHTRMPVSLPDRVTPGLAAMLARHRPLRVAVQVNHPRELDPEARQALRLLAGAGVSLLAQTVLLRGVNDRPDTLARLFTALAGCGVRPYHLFQPDLAQGTAHFRPSPERGLEVFRRAAALCRPAHLPRYMLDLPGGGGKVPVSESLLRECREGFFILPAGEGRCAVRYPAGEED